MGHYSDSETIAETRRRRNGKPPVVPHAATIQRLVKDHAGGASVEKKVNARAQLAQQYAGFGTQP